MQELNFIHAGFGDAAVDYETAWADQRTRHAARVADEAADCVVLLEHQSVYTAGKRTEPLDRPFDGTPVIDVDRGGKITWHGPGQLVGYPIVRLPEGVYVVDFVRRVEQVIIDAFKRGDPPAPSDTTTSGPSSSQRSSGRLAAARNVHFQSSCCALPDRGSAGSHCITSYSVFSVRLTTALERTRTSSRSEGRNAVPIAFTAYRPGNTEGSL